MKPLFLIMQTKQQKLLLLILESVTLCVWLLQRKLDGKKLKLNRFIFQFSNTSEHFLGFFREKKKSNLLGDKT